MNNELWIVNDLGCQLHSQLAVYNSLFTINNDDSMRTGGHYNMDDQPLETVRWGRSDLVVISSDWLQFFAKQVLWAAKNRVADDENENGRNKRPQQRQWVHWSWAIAAHIAPQNRAIAIHNRGHRV